MTTPLCTVETLFITDEEKQVHNCHVIELDPAGIVGDKHYGKEPSRTLLLTSVDAYRILEHHGIQAPYGSLGENIVIDYDLHRLQPGSRLKIGDAVIEIVQNCTLCNHLSKIEKRVPKLLRNDRGVFAKVVAGGKLHPGDEVYLVA